MGLRELVSVVFEVIALVCALIGAGFAAYEAWDSVGAALGVVSAVALAESFLIGYRGDR